MKQIYTLVALLLMAFCAAQAQTTATIRGKLIDSVGKQSLKDASITVMEAGDSTLDVFGLAKVDGSFDIGGITFGKMIVQITFQGYQPFSKTITFNKENAVVDLGNIYMIIQPKDLAEVIVTQSPIVIKNDTIEYNASSFKTKPNSVVEDLLKKLPGVEVAKDGSIKAQGETVSRVLVDGKRFFGDDPKMATKNLPPDIVDKIQVFDDQSDQSKFTGFDDGNRVKTINITTKKDKRKGYFGKGTLAGGYGPDDDGLLMDNSFNLSRYNGTQQVTVLGQGNNINKQNFSVRDVLGSLGNGGGRNASLLGSGTGNGITTTWALGGNYRDNWGKKTEASGSYFFNDQNTVNFRKSRSENLITADSSTFTDQTAPSETHNQNHRINFNIETKFDTSNSMIIRPNISFQNTDAVSSSISHTEDFKGRPISDINANSTRENSGYNGSIDATFRHRFKKRGRTYSIGINAGRNTNDGNGNNFSYNVFYRPDSSKTVNQQFVTATEGNTFSPTITYTEPIAKNQLIEISYNYNYNKNLSDRKTYNFNALSKTYNNLDTLQTNYFENTYNSNRVTVSYRIQNAKYNFSIGSGVQFGTLSSLNKTKGTDIEQNYTNLFPTATFNYNFTKTNAIRVFYNGRTSQPSVNQLQPLTTTSDSINFNQGNPALKQQFTHSLRMIYNRFDIFTQRIVLFTLNASMINNDIQNSIVYLPPTPTTKGANITRPVNLNGTYNVSGYFNYGFPIKKPKSNMNFATNVAYNQNQNLVNNVGNYTRNTTLGETVGWTTNLKENFDINFSSTSTYNIARQTLNPRQDANYFTETLSAEATYYSKSGWIVASEFDYIFNTGRSDGYNTSIPLWNASLSKQVFKKKQGEIKLSVFDLLHQNANVTRSVTDNRITDTQNKVLTQYFMLSFIYNLRRFGAQDQKMPNIFRNMMRGSGINMRGGGF